MIVPCPLLKNRLWGKYERDFFRENNWQRSSSPKESSKRMKPGSIAPEDARASPNGNPQLRLKQAGGWFAADESFARALEMLSDGAFKLFAWLCLRAARPSGRVEATQKELAAALGKSKRAVNAYVTELRQKQVCRVQPGANQYARTQFEIVESYWPYERANGLAEQRSLHDKTSSPLPRGSAPGRRGSTAYVMSVRKMFLRLGCGRQNFSLADKKFAAELARAGVPLAVVEDALLLGEARKYSSWLNHGPSAPIGSLEYFRALIDEVQQQPLPAGYREYLQATTREFARRWSRTAGLKPADAKK